MVEEEEVIKQINKFIILLSQILIRYIHKGGYRKMSTILDYVNKPYESEKTDSAPATSFAQFGIYDVLGEDPKKELKDGPNPSMDPQGYPRFDIEDPTWGTEQYPATDENGKPLTTGAKNWATGQLIFGLPSVSEKPKTCEDNCILKSKKRIAACNALRTRVKDALDKAGCPCDIEGKDKVSNCGASSGFPARSRRSRRSLRSRRSRPRRVVKKR